ncbi:MAG: amidophosphoribosyltransferase [Bacteroidota bacterium]
MSDPIKHECGIALIRLKKPLPYYQDKYGSALWGLNRLYLLLEKQRNRGQDGAGLATVKLDVPEGQPYIVRKRNNDPQSLTALFEGINQELEELKRKYPHIEQDPELLQQHFKYAGELLLGHLRYATHGNSTIDACHPVLRLNNWRSRTLTVAGNFNLTNVPELFQKLVDLGQHPRHRTDTETVLERIGHFLETENEKLFQKFKAEGQSNYEISRSIAGALDMKRIFTKAARRWDGGFTMAGLIGSGDVFVARDPNSIRPCHYYEHEDFVAVASERPAISNVFNVQYKDIRELPGGKVMQIRRNGKMSIRAFTEPKEQRSCSFERIYFSRGNDPDIYRERQELGNLLVPKILKAVNHDLDHTVFSYIPNTSEMAFWGMIKGVESQMIKDKLSELRGRNGQATDADLVRILSSRPRVEKVVLKDAKMRTFIADDSTRDDLVGHVYDITQGTLEPGVDNLVCIDDSIVRGTTLKKSILKILDRLRPKKIVIVSSAPQIRYPDCYGIDMSQIGRFAAFQAAIELLKERGMESIIQQVYQECLAMRKSNTLDRRNAVKAIYKEFTEDEVSRKIGELLTPKDMHCKVQIVYQPLANLAKAIPNHRGDWYFSGDYPTLGGTRVVNTAYINYIEEVKGRSY